MVERCPHRTDIARAGKADVVVGDDARFEEVLEVVFTAGSELHHFHLFGFGVPLFLHDAGIELIAPNVIDRIIIAPQTGTVRRLYFGQGEVTGKEHVVAVHADAIAAAFGGDDDSAAAAAHTIQGRCRGSLEHVDALDIIRGDFAEAQVAVGYAIHHQQGVAAAAPQTDVGRLIKLGTI